jgi:hypothetical protein
MFHRKKSKKKVRCREEEKVGEELVEEVVGNECKGV